MQFSIILNIGGHMYQIKKVLFTRAGKIQALVLLAFVFYFPALSQSKYNLQVTGGYAISDSWDVNGYNVGVSVNRKIWSVISAGIYFDNSSVDNLIPEMNSDGARHNEKFVPPALDNYIRSLDYTEALAFSQRVLNFMSFGGQVSFDFKISKCFKLGFYGGMGMTTRKESHFFLSDFQYDYEKNKLVDYTPITLFLKASELSFRYGMKFTFVLSDRFNLVLQVAHNASKYKKYPFGNTTYSHANLGVEIKL